MCGKDKSKCKGLKGVVVEGGGCCLRTLGQVFGIAEASKGGVWI